MNKKRVKKKTRWNVSNIVFFFFLIFMIILYIQYLRLSLSDKVYGIDMEKFAANRNTVTKELIAKRGEILDVNGETLAINVTVYNLIAYLDESRVTGDNPKYVVDKEKTARLLADSLGAPYEYILQKLNSDLYQVQFGNYGHNITELKKKEIESLNLPGIEFEKTTSRYYPNGNFASYTIGYAKANDNGSINGKLGIELALNEQLTGVNGYLKYQRDKYGYKIPDTKEEMQEAENGDDVYLTIDSSIQRFVESAINQVDDDYDPEWTLIEVMDAKTGAILASGSSKSYDPNNIPVDMSYEDPLVSYVYEPGSTMKIFTYMCAIDKGVYDGDDTFTSGSFKIDDETKISDWNKTGWGNISYDTGFEYSSNVAIANIIEKNLSKKELKDCFIEYGFGSTTDIELLSEAKGTLNFKYDIEVIAAGYGQGILTTPVQHLQALSIIANDGYMVKPHIVAKVVDGKTNKTTITKVNKSKRIVKESTVKKIKDLMEKVVSNGSATGYKYYIEGYDIIGKTGTAQIFENGKYLTGATDHISSISMMYPKEDPQIIIYAATKKPSHNQNYALSDSIKDLTKNIAKYYNIYDNNEVNSNAITKRMNNYINKNVDNVVQELNNLGFNPTIIGTGDTVINQYPTKGTILLSNNKVILVTNNDEKRMPSIIGWSRTDVIRLCNILKIDYKINGNGYVVSQSIKEGDIVNGVLEVNLEES